MKKTLLYLLLLCIPSVVLAQQERITISGTVIDEKGVPLAGAAVVEKDNNNNGQATDQEGRFRITIPQKGTLVFSFMGYHNKEQQFANSRERERIVLVEDVNAMDEVVVTAGGISQRRASIVGAVTTVNVGELQQPGLSVSNMLGGAVPGIISVTRSGEPGSNFSEFWVRGISTFGVNSSALILIDGVEGDLNQLDPGDIESFSILKDATATAIYGFSGANGVIIVTTKRGKAGKLAISVKSNVSYSYSPRMPDYVNSGTYALLANEAQVVRGKDPIYSAAEVELFQTGLDPDLYPDVNWRDVIMKDYSINHQHHMSASGGGENARYYISLGWLSNNGIFKPDKTANARKTNIDYNKYNFRTNVDANLTRTTTLSLNMEGVYYTKTAPGDGDNNQALWSAQANLPPTIMPVRYSNGQLPVYGKNQDEMSPYVRLNHTGYTEIEGYSMKSTLGLDQDLGMLIPGLSFKGRATLQTNGVHMVRRHKNPDLYYATGRNSEGGLITSRRIEKTDLKSAQVSHSNRRLYLETFMDYNQTFGDHRVSGLVRYYIQGLQNSLWGEDINDNQGQKNLQTIPRRYQAVSGRATYSFRDTYLAEINVGYTGSENFRKGNRYGVFPSFGIGWVPSQYAAFQDKVKLINYLKIRGSYGQTGNDRLSFRFPFLTVVGSSGGGPWGGSGLTETQIGAENLKWEVADVYNVGIDTRLWDNRISFEIDGFYKETNGIFQKRANIPDEAGLSGVLPYTNIGSMKNWGSEGRLSYTHTFNPDVILTVRGNFTYARNEVTYWEQAGVDYPYMSYTGVPYGVQRGLIALGLFRDEEDIRSSPKQEFTNDYMPGDIKYKDVNGDGVINDSDKVPINYSDVPQFQYGFAADFAYKNFRASILFEGVSRVEYFMGGTGYYPFAWESRGNVLTMVADQSNRWTPASYSGTADTENPNARFPRLHYGENKNNNRNSTFWLANGTYLRLKYVELSYRLSQLWMNKIGLNSVDISVHGDNLHVWDKVKMFDPAQASANGAVYPLQRTYTLQLRLNF